MFSKPVSSTKEGEAVDRTHSKRISLRIHKEEFLLWGLNGFPLFDGIMLNKKLNSKKEAYVWREKFALIHLLK